VKHNRPFIPSPKRPKKSKSRSKKSKLKSAKKAKATAGDDEEEGVEVEENVASDSQAEVEAVDVINKGKGKGKGRVAREEFGEMTNSAPPGKRALEHMEVSGGEENVGLPKKKQRKTKRKVEDDTDPEWVTKSGQGKAVHVA
jgi:hypothetical protein